MKKLFLSLLLILPTAWGDVINGLSFVINDFPVTLNDVNQTAKRYNCTNKEAVEILIQQKLEEGELEKFKISVDPYELDNTLDAFVAKNGLTLTQFKENLRSKMVDFNDYRADFKAKLLHDKLTKKIVASSINAVDERELRKYYDANSDKFSFPETINAIEYATSNKASIEAFRKNPMILPKDVQKEEVSLEAKTLNPQLLALLNGTKKGELTQPMNAGGSYVVFLIQDKHNIKTIPFEQAKNSVYNMYAAQNEALTVKSHFEKLKSSAKLQLIRVP